MNAFSFHRLTSFLVAIGITWWASSAAWAGPPATGPQAAVIDAELSPSGDWTGTVVTAEGIPVARTRLELASGDIRRPTASAMTDESGRFRFEKVHAGPYTLRYGNDFRVCRLWQFGTAPPAAAKTTLIVAGSTVTRGNLYDWAAAHPIITYAGIAAAIVVPVAVIGSAQHDDAPASP